MARYSLIVLKVPLNPISHSCII